MLKALDIFTKPSTSSKRYKVGEELGYGTFSKVYRARAQPGGEEFAVKVLRDPQQKGEKRRFDQDVLREIEINVRLSLDASPDKE